MDIRKSNGTIEEFNLEKLKNSICAAYEAIGEKCSDILLETATNNFYLYDNMSTVELRRQIEEWLMSVNKKVAKVYIENNSDGKDIKKKQDFIRSYIEASNAATGSKFDSNANVSNKNIVTLGQELYKENNIKQNRYILTNKIASLYTKKLSKQYLQDLENHILYKHDETGTPGYPYTYGSKEVVFVDYCGERLLVPFDLLYNIVDEEEVEVDSENVVFQKIMSDDSLRILDKDNKWTLVTHLTRKKRHRNLVRVKTVFGEDVIVTDNHPMITDFDNVDDNTVEAVSSEGITQLKIGENIVFKGSCVYDLADSGIGDVHDKYIVLNNGMAVKRHICLDRDFGYLVGFFVGDGNYNCSDDNARIVFTQKERGMLEHLNDILYDTFGITGKINFKRDLTKCYSLGSSNDALWYMLSQYFRIQDKAWNKTLPINIYETNEEFAKGVLEGLIDSDGTVNRNQLSIRLSSRAAVLQTTSILRHFGYSVGNTMRSSGFGNNKSYSTNYTIFGVNCGYNDNCVPLEKSFKFKKLGKTSIAPKYKLSGETTVYSVENLENSSFLELNDYIYDITTETHSLACNNILMHNCVAITMYPFLLDGLKGLGGVSVAPTDLKSFCGEFINLVYSISSQFLGAVATPEFLMYMDYFIRKDYGDDYLDRLNEIVEITTKRRNLEKVIENCFQQVVHSMNMPAGNRGYQTVFWNISYFDYEYFKGVFGDFRFPDGTEPKWETLSWLQKKFMKWFNQERTKYVLTFPVETMALLTNGKDDFADEEYADFTSEMWSEGHSFFCYLSDSPDSLSSCCRLRNSLKDLDVSDEDHNHTTHQYSMGTASVSTGSKSVMTINLPRLIQNSTNRYYHEIEGKNIPKGVQMPLSGFRFKDKLYEYIREDVAEMVERVHKYQTAFNETIKDFLKSNMLDVYNAGFIDIRKQYLTVGVNGITDAAEFLGIHVSNNEEYGSFVNNILETINMCNRKNKTREVMFNTEFVPAENLAAKNYKWDKKDGYWVSNNRNLYSSYFYNPEDDEISIIEKMKLHGRNFVKYLDGGSAAHLNLQEHLSKEQYRQLMRIAAEYGCNYFTFNVKNTCCEDCGYIDKNTLDECPHCGSKNLTYLTRVIGYLKKTSSFSEARQIEEKKRFYDMWSGKPVTLVMG